MRAAIPLFAVILIQNPQARNPQQGEIERGDHDAIYAFLLFQMIDHQTGDRPSIMSEPQK